MVPFESGHGTNYEKSFQSGGEEMTTHLGRSALADGVSVSVVDVGKESTNTMDTTLFHKTCSGCPIAHLLPG